MSLGESVRSVFSNYVNFSGRARRSEYWWWTLVSTVVSVAIYVFLGGALAGMQPGDSMPPLALVATFLLLAWVLVTFLPSLAVAARRLHDTGRSGWWLLLSLVPFVGPILLLVWNCQDSHRGSNQYGPSPKYNDDAGSMYGGQPAHPAYPQQPHGPQ